MKAQRLFFKLIEDPVRSLRLVLILVLLSAGSASAQRSGLVLFGDVKIDDRGFTNSAPPKVMIILYKDVGGEIGRQPISDGSRYTFRNLAEGNYELAIEADNNEIGRVRVTIQGLSNDPHGFRQDLDFALKAKGPSGVPGVLSAADIYNRPAANKALFEKAQEAANKKKYDQAAMFLQQVLDRDRQDFQAWTLLGTIYRLQDKADEAEKAYLNALNIKPTFVLALIDLGRLRSSQKKYEEAVEPLTHAVAAQPESGDANLLLGEAYLQLKKGSKAIPYLNAAANNGKPEAHLRLGWLYNAAGIKDKAAIEYEEFLRQQPNYPDRKKLEDYISANKKN
jgi:tetratricopeptide (TPR) repeat protein